MRALIAVTLKHDVLDPQGKAIKNASASLGYDGVTSVRQGKLFEVNHDAADEAAARALIEELSVKLLSNPVIEDFEIVKVGG